LSLAVIAYLAVAWVGARDQDSMRQLSPPRQQMISDNYFCRSTTIRFAGSSTSG
jgi:hypothetical protein